jgi:hypothetical protein
MAHFYINVYNSETTLDDVGSDFPGLPEATAEARSAAADLIREEILAGGQLQRHHRIEVEDENRRVVHVLKFDELIAD